MNNQKIWQLIKEIKAGDITLEEAKGMLNSKEWNTLNDVFEIEISPRLDPNYAWVHAVILNPANK